MVNVIRTQPTCLPAPTVQAPESSADETPFRPDETLRAKQRGSLTCRWTLVETANGGPVLTAIWVETTGAQ